MTALSKVSFIRGTDGKIRRSVYSSIHTFLARKAQDSGNTADTYERHIRGFFKTMVGKDIENLSENDLIFTKEETERYQTALREAGYKGSTINATISSLSSLYKKLEDYNYNVKASWFDLDRYDESDTESYGTLTWEQVEEIMARLRSMRMGEQKALLVNVAVVTSFRLESLLNLKWRDLEKRDGVWTAKAVYQYAKGNKEDVKAIPNELYDELMSYKETQERGQEKIFPMSDKTVERMMKKIREEMNLPDNIKFHSFKKAGIEEVRKLTGGDVKAMQRQGNHASASTTLDRYVVHEDDFSKMPSLEIGKKIDLSILNDLSKEDIINIITNSNRGIQIHMVNEAKKVVQ